MKPILPIFVAVLHVCFGCESVEPDDYIDIVFDPCEPIYLQPLAVSSEQQQQGLHDGIRMWNELLGASIEVEDVLYDVDPWDALSIRERQESRTIPVVFEKAAQAFRGYYDDELGVIYLNEGLTGENISVTLAHEIGHTFGLFHVEETERISVMNHGNMTVVPNRNDASDVEAIWGRCHPSQNSNHQGREDEHPTPL